MSFVLEGGLLSEQFRQMPGDRFAFAVRVSRQQQSIGIFQRALDGIDVFLVAVDDLVFHGKAIVRIHGAFFGNQIAHMPVRGEDFVVHPKILLDGAPLGG